MKLFSFSTSTASNTKKKSNNKKKKPTTKPNPNPNPNPSFSNSRSSSSSASSSGSPSSPISVLRPGNAATLEVASSSSTTFTSSYDFALASPGKVTREELELLLRRLGGDEQADDEITSVLKGEGMVMLEDMIANGGGAGEEELRGAFGVFDANGDGKISAEELHGLFVMMGDGGCSIEDCRRMIGGVDSDGDGFVSFGDFARMMMDGRI